MNKPGINATYPIDKKDYVRWDPTQEYLLIPNSILKSIQNDR